MNLTTPRQSFLTALRARSLTLLLAICHALLSPALAATLICRWVDEKGHTHIADVVPDGYTKIATCIDSAQYELTPEQRRDTEQRNATERSKAGNDKANLGKKAASRASRPVDAASQPKTKRRKGVVTDATDCATWWRLYDESSECFGPYKTLRGIRPEAFDNCNEVASPEPKCGLRSN